MSTTVSYVVREHLWKEDKTNFVRIRVIHNRQTRYIKTNLLVNKSDMGRSGQIKDLEKLNAAEQIVRDIRKVVSDIDMFQLNGMDADEVVREIEEGLKKPEKFVLDFIEFGYKVAKKKSEGNAKTYYVALNALLRYFKGRHPDISEITVRNLRGFAEYILAEDVVKVNWRSGRRKTIKKKKGGRAASLYLSNIRHIYKSARMEYNDPDLGLFPIPNDPFEYFTLPKAPSSKHKDIPVEVIQKMIDTRKECKDRVRMAVDAFLISFGLCGINAADMYIAAKPKNDVLHYYRKKTTKRRDDRAEMWVKIHPCIKNIMKDYKGKSVCFDYSVRYSSDGTFTTALNSGLKIWRKRYNIEEDFRFGSARHSWATIGSGKLCNIERKIMTAGMCHKDEDRKVDDIYTRFDWEQLWDAQQKILDVFDWK